MRPAHIAQILRRCALIAEVVSLPASTIVGHECRWNVARQRDVWAYLEDQFGAPRRTMDRAGCPVLFTLAALAAEGAVRS